MSLHNICNIGDMTISEKLENNLISYFDWGFVDKGGYINVNVGQTGCFVDDRSILTKVTDPRATGTLYFQGPENWVYESGSSSTPAPFIPPLVYVNSTLDLTPTINYRDGRVTPSISVPSNATVKAKFAYKWVTFTSARKSFNHKRVQYRQNRTDLNTADIKMPPEIRMPLPAVVIDVPPISRSKPYGIDRWGARVYFYDVDLYIIGESAADVARISDYLILQTQTNINTFDPKLVVLADDFPLNFNGTIHSGKNHQQLSEDYPWSTVWIDSATGIWSGYLNEHIYQANVRLKLEFVACLNC